MLQAKINFTLMCGEEKRYCCRIKNSDLQEEYI